MKHPNCIISGKPVDKCFKHNGKCYAFCCMTSMAPLIKKVCCNDPKVKNVTMKSSKGLKVVKLSEAQKKKLMMAAKMPSVKKGSRTRKRRSSSKRSSKKRKTSRR
tara:strand:- start:894 stop:1208 length:315 start_codon:yes stop_codon:yes gene_type:complete